MERSKPLIGTKKKGENKMEETEKALNLIYEKMCEELEERHIRWVNQNFAMRGIELAKTQIKTEGDTEVNYAMALLDGGYTRLKGKNKKECDEMYALESFVFGFVRKAEELVGVKLDREKIDKAMNAMDNPRKLPPLPF